MKSLPAFLAICGNRRTRDLCIAVAVAVCAWRWFNTVQPIGNQQLIFYRTDLRLDALFDGALAAILLHDVRIRRVLRKAGPWIMWTVGPAGLIAARLIPSMTLSRSIVALSIPLFLLAGILFPETLFARVLEFHWLRWVGRVSYSIYIWQGLFTSNERHLLWGERFWALNLFAMLGTSIASYYLLERPLIRWGHRMRKPANQGRPDLQ